MTIRGVKYTCHIINTQTPNIIDQNDVIEKIVNKNKDTTTKKTHTVWSKRNTRKSIRIKTLINMYNYKIAPFLSSSTYLHT